MLNPGGSPIPTFHHPKFAHYYQIPLMIQIYPTVNNDNKYIENRSINKVKPANTFGAIHIEWSAGAGGHGEESEKAFQKGESKLRVSLSFCDFNFTCKRSLMHNEIDMWSSE